MTTRFVALKESIQPQTHPTINQFEIVTVPTPTITGENQVLFQTLFLSVDPYLRMRMFEGSFYSFYGIGNPVSTSGIGRVIESSHPEYRVGDVVSTFIGLNWPVQEIVLLEGELLKGKKKIEGIDPSHYSALVGNLGMPGFTAYFGLVDRLEYKPGETLLISGASGAVGNVLGQLAKDVGLRVVGITSNQEKANFLREVGFDDVVLYPNKTRQQLAHDIRQACPNGVDIYFDNVGGLISDAAIDNINVNGRIPVCGAISKYNNSDLKTVMQTSDDIKQILTEKNIKREFFTVNNYIPRYEEAFTYLLNKVREGKLIVRETVFHGIENWPTAFLGLFTGENTGKAVVRVDHR